MIDTEELAARIEALTETGQGVSLEIAEWREVVSALRYWRRLLNLPTRSETDFEGIS